MRTKLLRAALIATLAVGGVVACKQEGPMERAGRNADQAVDRATTQATVMNTPVAGTGSGTTTTP